MENTNHTTHAIPESETETTTTNPAEAADGRKFFVAPDVSSPITVGSLTLAASTTGAGGGTDSGQGLGLDGTD